MWYMNDSIGLSKGEIKLIKQEEGAPIGTFLLLVSSKTIYYLFRLPADQASLV